MTIVYVTLLNLIISFLFVYGVDSSITEECIAVYKLLNKAQTSNCCFEDGINCEQGHIYALYLFDNLLSGSIPTEIGNLSELQTLILRGNELTGSIPQELGNLTKLQYLDLSSNSFSGSIPTSFGNLAQLQNLNLSNNTFSGSIPTSIGNLSQLQTLDLSHNTFVGSIPKELEKLTNLKFIYSSHNNFDGSIPKELGKLTNLEFLDLRHNNFVGSIPKELGNLKKLKILDLSYNSLNGSIPPEIGNLTELVKLDLTHNNLCGDVFKAPKTEIMIDENKNIGDTCPDEELQQNNDTNNEVSKEHSTTDTTQKKNNEGSHSVVYIIVGVLALLLILIILGYFINKNKKDKTVKINNKTSNKTHPSDMDDSNDTKNNLPLYTFIEEKYFEWKIENWSQLNEEEYSSPFDAHEHLWKLLLITNSFNDNNEESVDVGLTIYDEINDNDYIYVNFVVYFRNYNNSQVYKSVKYDDEPTLYNAKTLDHGINDAILKSELYSKMNDGCSLLENNKIIIGVLIKFYSLNQITIHSN